ncbi:hypothetical protein T06_7511 [Trichinella sp. T6]|nr:hypothetical protein T06_7511 [Trichinella sp. T6]
MQDKLPKILHRMKIMLPQTTVSTLQLKRHFNQSLSETRHSPSFGDICFTCLAMHASPAAIVPGGQRDTEK